MIESVKEPGWRRRNCCPEPDEPRHAGGVRLFQYNARPQWLADAHSALDAAVAAAYGWSVDITDDNALRELLELNSNG